MTLIAVIHTATWRTGTTKYVEHSIESPIPGRMRAVWSDATELDAPYVAASNPIDLPFTEKTLIISPLSINFTAADLTLTPATITWNYSIGCGLAELALDECAVTFARFCTTNHTTTYKYDVVVKHTTSYEYPPAIALHTATYTTLLQLNHQVQYGSNRITTSHTHTYQSATPIITTHTHTYQSATSVIATHTNSWTTIAQIYATHTALYAKSQEVNTTHTVQYAIFTPGYLIHEAVYRSNGTGLVLSIHTTSYTSTQLSTTSHAQTYQSLALATTIQQSSYCSFPTTVVTHTAIYKAVTSTYTTHLLSYQTVPTDYTIHTLRYRSANLTAVPTLANVYIDSGIQLVSATVTADEDSPYYQCDIELHQSTDYQQFERDQAFTLYLFNDTYAFVVDSKSLSRTIDDEGHYKETATLSGLSPLCRFANPRATPVTKTWTTPTNAKAIVEELLGTVTWNLVDWQIPAYRLSADSAAPLDVAKQIVEAAGGLIESNPDGSVVVRHRWPTSIALLNTVSPDHILHETSIYSASESPTQDELMNKVRILDSNAGYQDRLEYVPNKIDEDDDPWSGILYAFLSPWRDGLTIATTRGSKIQLGSLSEGTRTIGDSEEYPPETITFENGNSTTQYPIATITAFTWLDDVLGGVTFTPYSTTIEATDSGTYGGYSLAEIEYTTRYLKVPVYCTESDTTIEAQFLLLENQNA